MSDESGGDPIPRVILLVDDQVLLRHVLARLIERLGHTVREYASGREALDDLVDASPPADLLITDIMMPGMLGTDLVRLARAERPGLPVIMVTGYSGPADDVDAVRALPNVALLTKPFTIDTLRDAIEAAFASAV